MEEEIIKTDKTPALLPALGILGLGIGTVALVLGIFAMKKSGDISESMSDKIEKAAALSLEIKKLSDRTDALALQIEDMKSGDDNRVEKLAKQTNDVVIKLNSMIAKNREAINDLNKAVEKLASRPAQARNLPRLPRERNPTPSKPRPQQAAKKPTSFKAAIPLRRLPLNTKRQSTPSFAPIPICDPPA